MEYGQGKEDDAKRHIVAAAQSLYGQRYWYIHIHNPYRLINILQNRNILA